MSGNGLHGAVVGSPFPAISTNTLNGLKVVRFKANEGRVRGNTGLSFSSQPAPKGSNFTTFYVGRYIGPGAGYGMGGEYPNSSFYHGITPSGDEGASLGTTSAAYTFTPTWWRQWCFTASHNGSVFNAQQFIDGAVFGYVTNTTNSSFIAQGSLNDRYAISGFYDTTATQTCDCEIAEVLIYNRKLTDVERIQVQDYLNKKWGIAPVPFTPKNYAGLTVWLDASKTEIPDNTPISGWSDFSGAGNTGAIVGSPAPLFRNIANSWVGPGFKWKAIRTAVGAGRIRGNSGLLTGDAGYNYAAFYTARVIGTANRVFSGEDPNYMYHGFYQTGLDGAFDGNWVKNPVAYTAIPTPVITYVYYSFKSGATFASNFYRDRTALANFSGPGQLGLQGRYAISGYQVSGAAETADADINEVIIYNRSLSAAERQFTTDYLTARWGNVAIPFDFTVAVWTKFGSTITANAVAGPAAGPLASKIVESVGGLGVGHGIYLTDIHSDATTYTYSFYAKAAGRNSLILIFNDNSSTSQVYFSLVGAGDVLAAFAHNAQITHVGNGWYRCVMTAPKGPAASGLAILYMLGPGNLNDYSGDGVSGIYVWGAELVRGGFPSPNMIGSGSSSGGSSVAGVSPTNIITQPNALDHALWAKSGGTVSANIANGPTTASAGQADKFVEASGGGAGTYRYWQWISPHSDVAKLTYSVYLKAAGRSGVRIYFSDTANDYADFLLTGAGSLFGGGVGAVASIQNVGNGWYRCILSSTAAHVGGGVVTYLHDGTRFDYVGDGTSGILQWGAELIRGPATQTRISFGTSQGRSTVTGVSLPPRSANLNRTLENVTFSGQGIAPSSGQLTQALGNLGVMTSMNVGRVLTLTSTLADSPFLGSAQAVINGTQSATLGLTFVGTGSLPARGTATPTLGALTVAGTGDVDTTGAVNQTLGNVTVATVGSAPAIGLAVHTLAPLTLNGVAGQLAIGALTQTLEIITVHATGGSPPVGGVFQTLQNVTLTSGVTLPINAVFNRFLADVALVTAGNLPNDIRLSQTLEPVVLASLGNQVNHYTLTQTLASTSVVGLGIKHATDSSRWGAGYALLDDVTAVSSTTTAVRGTVDKLLDNVTLTSVLGVPVTAMGVLSMAPATFTGTIILVTSGGLTQTLDDSPFVGIAHTGAAATLDRTLADATFVGNAALLAQAAATNALANAYTISETHGYVPVVGSLAKTLGEVTLVSDAGGYLVARANVTLEDLGTDLAANAIITATHDTYLPNIEAELVAIAPTLAALTRTLQSLVGTGAIAATAGGTATPTLANATLVADAQGLVTAVAVMPLGGLELVADAGVIIGGTHSTQLADTQLEAVSFGLVSAYLTQTFDELVGVGNMIHVRRTPVLHAQVFVNYVHAEVRVESIHAEVKTSFLHMKVG
jgi:hypothetical protein